MTSLRLVKQLSVPARYAFALSVTVGCSLAACSDSGGTSPGAGGSAAAGGSGAGGSNPGGSGGSAAGGSAAGGSAAGGSAAGGSGGSAAGGSATGGSAGQDPVFPTEHPRIYLNQGTRTRLQSALTSAAPEATRFRDLVDAQLAGGNSYDYQAWYSGLMFVLSGEDRYADDAIQRVDAWVQSEQALIDAGERAEVAADSYLYVGDHIGNLALVYDWCFARLSTDQRQRWLAYANHAVSNVWDPDGATWGGVAHPWSGWSVNNPSNNYYYSFLRATMLLGLASRGEDPAADGWIAKFREEKIGEQLAPTFTRDLTGGGSREGTGYGVAMMRLFELYELWQGTTGERVAELSPHARGSLLHMLHAIVPSRDRLAPVGDHSRDSSAALFDYHRNYLQLLMRLFPTDPVAGNAQWLLANSSVPRMSQQFMYAYDFLYRSPDVAERPLNELNSAYYAAGTGQLYLRSNWDADATWVHLIAGPYTESHAHQDQGSMMFYGGDWLAYDANIESHSGIRQEVELHNLVRIERDGSSLSMREGEDAGKLLALRNSASFAYAACDVTAAYGSGSGVSKLERELVYLKPDVVVLFDRADTAAGDDHIWQINSPAPFVASGPEFTSGALHVRSVHPTNATSNSLSWSAIDSDFSSGYRLELMSNPSGGSRFLTLVSRGAAFSASTSRSAADTLGVEVTLASGERFVVDFKRDSVGGRLDHYSAAGSLIEGVDLSPGVEQQPVLAP